MTAKVAAATGVEVMLVWVPVIVVLTMSVAVTDLPGEGPDGSQLHCHRQGRNPRWQR